MPTKSFLARFLDFFKTHSSVQSPVNDANSFDYTLRKMALLGIFESVAIWASSAKTTISQGRGIPEAVLGVYMNGILNAMALAERIMQLESTSQTSTFTPTKPSKHSTPQSTNDTIETNELDETNETNATNDSDGEDLPDEVNTDEDDENQVVTLDSDAFAFIMKTLKSKTK